MHKLLDLISEYLVEARVAVPHVDSRDAACQVDVLLPCVVVEVLQVASHCVEWLFIVWLIKWEQMLLM